MRGQPGHNSRPHARLQPSFLGTDARMISQLNVVLIRKLLGSLLCLAYSFDMLSMRDSTTSHWQTSGRLVQELNVCTVRSLLHVNVLIRFDIRWSVYKVIAKYIVTVCIAY